MGKILIIVTIALAAITAGLGFLNRGTLVQTRETLATTQGQLETTRSELAAKTASLNDANKKVEELTAKNDLALAEITKLKADNQTKDSKISDLETKVADADAKVQELNSSIATLQQENESFKTAAVDTTGPAADDAQLEIDSLKMANGELESKLKSAQDRIASMEEKLVEKKRIEKLNSLSGRILAVNEAWNFVVLNLGNNNGISSNTELLVKRGNTQIGRVRITSVEPASSIADIIPGSLVRGLSIQPGDYVITQYAAN
jgi:predicted RNase H-like nuclease (RuvC/YqgF family)